MAKAPSDPRPHHPLSPSNWTKWVKCPGFEKLRDEDEASRARLERGNRAHRMLEAALTGEPVQDSGEDACDLWEQAEWAAGEIMRSAPCNLRVEVQLKMPDYAPKYFGYADVTADGHVWDLKTGYFDDGYRAQLAGYALAVMDFEMRSELTLHLLYSECQRHEEWTLTYVEAAAIARDVLAARAAAVEKREGLVAGEICGRCALAGTCPALAAAAAPAVEAAVELMPAEDVPHLPAGAGPLTSESVTSDPLAAGRFLFAFKAMEDIAGRAEAFVRAELLDGRPVPGFELQNGSSPSYVPAEEVVRWASSIGADRIITAYGGMPVASFKKLYAQVFPDKEFPPAITHQGKGFKRLCRVKPRKSKKAKALPLSLQLSEPTNIHNPTCPATILQEKPRTLSRCNPASTFS
ncbi:hypothetical protein DB346_05390 [Verrucomicrobia bacterium LW23]|nr:hypothetical protein DB346_05390 [Verrucomicrobia bacterium LW23]